MQSNRFDRTREQSEWFGVALCVENCTRLLRLYFLDLYLYAFRSIFLPSPFFTFMIVYLSVCVVDSTCKSVSIYQEWNRMTGDMLHMRYNYIQALASDNFYLFLPSIAIFTFYKQINKKIITDYFQKMINFLIKIPIYFDINLLPWECWIYIKLTIVPLNYNCIFMRGYG